MSKIEDDVFDLRKQVDEKSEQVIRLLGQYPHAGIRHLVARQLIDRIEAQCCINGCYAGEP